MNNKIIIMKNVSHCKKYVLGVHFIVVYILGNNLIKLKHHQRRHPVYIIIVRLNYMNFKEHS